MAAVAPPVRPADGARSNMTALPIRAHATPAPLTQLQLYPSKTVEIARATIGNSTVA